MVSKLASVISERHHGFVRNRSTHSNLLNCYFDIFTQIDSRKSIDVITIDMNKAFDKVNHSILLEKLSNLGISPKFLNLIRSFLSNRKQRVRYGNELSDAADIPSVVPQGSVLSPLFFAIFVNDLLCKSFSNSIICYADDIKIWGPPSDSIGSDIGLLSEWMESNYMSVNTDKCEVIHFGRNNHHRSYFYRNTPIRVVQEFRDLGVLVDSKLTFRSHSLSAYLKCLRLIHIIFKVFSSRSAGLY